MPNIVARNIKRGENTALFEEIKDGNIMGNFNSSSIYKNSASKRQRKKSQYEVGHYYKYNSLKKWINSKGTDPMNRTRKLTGNNIKKYKARLINNAPANLPFDPPVSPPRPRTLRNTLKSYTQSQAHKNAQMIKAIQQNQPERVKEYILRGADVNFKVKLMDDRTPLIFASEQGNLEIAKILLKAGADINAIDNKNEETALITAVKNQHMDIIELLLDSGANINLSSKNILLFPIKMRNYDMLNLLLEKGADPNNEGYGESGYRPTPLMEACEHSLIDMIQLLLIKHADINKRIPGYTSPLGFICKSGDIEIANLLIQNGALLTPDHLSLATANGHLELISLFLDSGIDVNSINASGYTPLMYACGRGRLETVQLLLSKGADVNLIGEGLDSPLKKSVKSNNLELVHLLIEKGADVNRIVNKRTALTDACNVGNIDIVRLLLDNNADVNYTYYFYTPFTIACEEGHADIVNLLINKGGGHTEHDKRAISSIKDAACKKGNWKLLWLLSKKGFISSPPYCNGYLETRNIWWD
jgi:ankyrin repeat protein